ncbi:MAG: M56 family metallopeptidase [Chitinophagales bacterium]|nr:M56 family metallopeptidase [Chitinophagales bacterium]
MQTLANSVLLQSLGYAIIHSLWQVALLWTAYIIITNILKLSAKTKYVLAVTTQITSFIWFILTCTFYYIQCSEAIKQTNFSISETSNIVFINYEVNSFRSFLLNIIVTVEKFLPYISFAYLLLLIIFFVRWNNHYNNVQSIRKSGLSKIDVHWRLFVKETAALLGIKKEVKIFLSEKVTTPIAIGFLKPIILIPLASINHLSTTQMEAVLLHELAHIKRMDYLLNILLSIIEIALFFNPFIKSISNYIQMERENSCDDWVLQFQYNSTLYAEALLKVAMLHTTNSSLTMNAVNNKNSLVKRVRRMTIEANQLSFNYKKQILALLFISFIAISIIWLIPNHNSFQTKKNQLSQINTNKDNNKNVLVYIKPMTAKISNPLFNPLFFFKKPLQEEINRNIEISEQKVTSVIKNVEKIKSNNSLEQAKTKNIKIIEEVEYNENENIVTANIDSLKIISENLMKEKIVFGKYFNDKLNQFNEFVKDKSLMATKEITLKKKNNLQQERTGNVITLRLKTDSLLSEKNNSKSKAQLLADNFNYDEFYDEEYEPATKFPVHYAFNLIQDSSLNNMTTSIDYVDEVMVIKIKRKKQQDEDVKNSTTQNKEPKRYDIVVSNPGEPDKRIIIEVW